MFMQVIGTSQDGGYPHAGCEKRCCNSAWMNFSQAYVSSLALVDQENKTVWLIDCTPDFNEQWHLVNQNSPEDYKLEGILLTHAHIGHYLGLADLGREVMGSKGINVYAMPRMKSFIEKNGPWDQLVSLGNIELKELENENTLQLSENLSLTPFLVPHRDEYSETIGFKIKSRNKSILYIPDIDKWQKWDKNIIEEIKKVDLAYIDGTFYDQNELPNRNMSDIPHPFVVESMDLMKELDTEDRAKVHFIHINHSNPIHYDKNIREYIKKKGYNTAEQGKIVEL